MQVFAIKSLSFLRISKKSSNFAARNNVYHRKFKINKYGLYKHIDQTYL